MSSSQAIPEGDVFIHAGDFTRCGSVSEVRDFNAWLAKGHLLDSVIFRPDESCRKKLIIPNAIFYCNEKYYSETVFTRLNFVQKAQWQKYIQSLAHLITFSCTKSSYKNL